MMNKYNRKNMDILKGWDSALLQSFPISIDASTGKPYIIPDGSWVKFNADGTVQPVIGGYVITMGPAFPAFAGNEVRLDNQALNVATICLGKSYYAETNQVAAVTINPGDPLTVDDGVLTKSVTTDATLVGWATSAVVDGRIKFTRA